MNRDDGVSFLVDFFSKLEVLVNTPLKYLDFSVTLKNRDDIDRKINVLSFNFEEDLKTRVFLFPSDYKGVGIFNSRAVLYHTDKFFRIKKDEELVAAINNLLPKDFELKDVEFSFEVHEIELKEISKYALAVDKIKKKFK